MVAGEQRALFDEREAQMIGAMAGRCDGFDRAAGALKPLAVGEDRIGRIVAVVGGVEAGRPIGLPVGATIRGRSDLPALKEGAAPGLEPRPAAADARLGAQRLHNQSERPVPGQAGGSSDLP